MGKKREAVVIGSSSEQGEPQYEVQQVLERRTITGEDERPIQQYLVKWVGYPKSDATWEPIENLQNAGQKIKEFLLSRASQQYRAKINETRVAPQPVVPAAKQKELASKPKKHKTVISLLSEQPKRKRILSKSQIQPIQKPTPVIKQQPNKQHSQQSSEQQMHQNQRTKQQVNPKQEPISDKFKIVGLIKPETTFVVEYADKTQRQITANEMRQKYPTKLIDFYESKIYMDKKE